MSKNLFQKAAFFALVLLASACSNNSKNSQVRSAFPSVERTAADAVTEAAASAAADASEESNEKDAVVQVSGATGTTYLATNSGTYASEPSAPTARKFLRTAELQYRTQNVQKTTETMENWTRSYGGFVLQSALSTSIDNTNTSPVGSDSLLENTIYTIHNTMILRVPNQYFDTLLTRINGTMDFLELRKISADDVSLTMLGNKIRSSNARQMANRLRGAIDRSSKKLSEMTEAERIALEAQNDADAAAVRNLNLQDKVDFCTVEARIYQRPIVQQRTILNLNKYIDYSPPFFPRVWEALRGGWFVIMEVFFALLSLWFLAPMAFVCVLLFKAWRNRK
jgi:CRP-like cAMP-binding protein